MIGFSFPACGRGNSARRACRASPLGGRIGCSAGKLPRPKPSPWGVEQSGGLFRSGPGEATINHRCPSAHTGADEGAIWYPTFLCRKRGGYQLSPQRSFSVAPVGQPGSPPHPSPSVTASPQGEAFAGGTPPQQNTFAPTPRLPQNANPNQGTYMGSEIAQQPPRCAPPRQNQRVASERAIKMGGRGASPRDSLRPGFL